jgi:hypothetical protein
MIKKILTTLTKICSISAIPLFLISIGITLSNIINNPIADIIYSWTCLALGWGFMLIGHLCKRELRQIEEREHKDNKVSEIESI